MRKRVTIREIGRLVGVSHATVSYVLSGQGDLRAIPVRTQERVRVAANDLGWQPNHMLSALSTGRTRLVGLWQSGLGEPYHAWVMQTTERLLSQEGYAMMVSPAHIKDGSDEFDLGLFGKWSVDGLMGLDGPRQICRFLRKHPHWRLPMVSMGAFALTDDPRVDSVAVDVLSPAAEGLHRFAADGRRRIAMLSGLPPGEQADSPREQVYKTFIRDHRLPEELISFTRGPKQRLDAETALRGHIAGHGCPDAIFCRADETLMGAYKALRDLGKHIPDEVALLGIDGIQDLRYLDHPVSTVVQPVDEMCRMAWEDLQDRIAHPDRLARHRTLTGVLDWR